MIPFKWYNALSLLLCLLLLHIFNSHYCLLELLYLFVLSERNDGKSLCRYALGGYDGFNMVSTVEIYDPRYGSWMNVEPMNTSRGYAGAVVIGEEIYIIGGLKDNNEIIDTVCNISGSLDLL